VGDCACSSNAVRAAAADARCFSIACRCKTWNSVRDAWNSRPSLPCVYFWDGYVGKVSATEIVSRVRQIGLERRVDALHQSLTPTSGHCWTCFKPCPISLKPLDVSSIKSDTRSLTRSVSRLVPSSATWFASRDMFDVREKSLSESSDVTRLNSGSSLY
jgi:hypothetical protein